MATTAERLGIVETKVANLDEKIDHLQGDIKASHDDIKAQLTTMYDASCKQHSELANKIKDLEGFKAKWTYLILGGLAVLGWLSSHWDKVDQFFK